MTGWSLRWYQSAVFHTCWERRVCERVRRSAYRLQSNSVMARLRAGRITRLSEWEVGICAGPKQCYRPGGNCRPPRAAGRKRNRTAELAQHLCHHGPCHHGRPEGEGNRRLPPEACFTVTEVRSLRLSPFGRHDHPNKLEARYVPLHHRSVSAHDCTAGECRRVRIDRKPSGPRRPQWSRDRITKIRGRFIPPNLPIRNEVAPGTSVRGRYGNSATKAVEPGCAFVNGRRVCN